MTQQSDRIHIVGIGGTLRDNSTSLAALQRALQAAEAAGATTELIDLNTLRLPMYEPDRSVEEYDANVQQFIATINRADGMIWSTAGYHGTLAGVTKNALDFLEFLSEDARPYLHGRTIGLIATASGDLAAVNAANAMVHVAHALRGTVVPLLAPIGGAKRIFDADGNVIDAKWAGRLDQLGALVAETAARFVSQPVEA